MALYRAGTVADQLKVAPTTIRAWSNEFATFLSPSAGRQMTATGQRRYSDADIAVFGHVKRLLATGLSYSEVRDVLTSMTPEARAAAPVDADQVGEVGDTTTTALARPDLLDTIQKAIDAAVEREREAGQREVAALQAHLAEVQAERDRLRQQIDEQPKSLWDWLFSRKKRQ